MLLVKRQNWGPCGSKSKLPFLFHPPRNACVQWKLHPGSGYSPNECVALSQVKGVYVLERWSGLEATLQAIWMTVVCRARTAAGFQSSKSRNKSWSLSAKALEAAGGLHVYACQTARLVITHSHAGRMETPAKYVSPSPYTITQGCSELFNSCHWSLINTAISVHKTIHTSRFLNLRGTWYPISFYRTVISELSLVYLKYKTTLKYRRTM